MTFYDFMMSRYFGEDSPAGDLASDMRADEKFPKEGRHQKILTYLHSRFAIRECLDTFEACWKEYVRND